MKSNKNLIDYRIEFIIGIHTPFIDSIDVRIDCFIWIEQQKTKRNNDMYTKLCQICVLL